MNFLSSMINSLGGSAVSLLIYAIIILVFIIGLILCVFPVTHNRGILLRATRVIRRGEDSRRSWQEDSFLGHGSMREHWSEYLNNLFFADGVYHNASNVEDFINEETVIYGPGRSAFSDAIPGLLVSLGFLGTLIGLAQGLSGFSVSDSEAAMSSIVTLIPGMRYAFMTSIFGVIGSVLFTLITRLVQGSTEHALRDFYGAMSRYAGVQSVDPMTQVAIYQQQQTQLIRQMSEDLAGKLSDNVAVAVSQAVEPLNNSLRAFVSVTTKDQMRFLDAGVSRFIDRMDETLSGQLKRLSSAIDDAASSQEATTSNMRETLSKTTQMLDSVREVSGVAEEMVRGNARYIEQLRDLQKQSETEYKRMQDSVGQMDLTVRQQSNYLKSVNAMQADVARSVAQMGDSLKTYTDRVAESTANACTDMLKASAELRATGAELKEIHAGTAAQINDELKRTLDAYQDYVNEFTQRVDYLAANISGALNDLPGAVNETSDRFLNPIDHMADAMVQAQRVLDDAIVHLYAERQKR